MIRQDIERSAAQVAAEVRRALSDFNRTTGLCARVDVEWGTHQSIDGRSPIHTVARVIVEVGGLAVEA